MERATGRCDPGEGALQVVTQEPSGLKRLRPALRKADGSRSALVLLGRLRDHGLRAARDPCRLPAASAPVRAARSQRAEAVLARDAKRAAAVAVLITIFSETAPVPGARTLGAGPPSRGEHGTTNSHWWSSP